MDKKEIMSVWAAFQEVQEKKNKKLDPVGKEDGDVDNDGDEDSSDEYLANRRKKVGAAMKKEGTLPPALQKAIDKKKGKKVDDDDSDEKSDDDSEEKSEKPKKGENPFAKKDKKDVKESEGSYPAPKKVKKAGDALEPVNNRTAKLKEEDSEECPKCKGKGCDHCDGKGYHSKKVEEKLNFDLFSEAELAALAEKMKQPGDTGGKGEEFMSTSSPKEKKVMADHEAGSNKKYEDWEDTSEKDASKAGKAVKSQSPVRRGESRKSETMGKVKGS